jgi:hypothetical protein
MRRLIGAVVLLAGCASTNEYVAGPPTTVREPTFSGQVHPRQPAYSRSEVQPAQAAVPQPSTPPAYDPIVRQSEPRAPITGRFSQWLRSGRGWVWGAARRGPIRDEELDRAMVDTLTSGRPGYSRNPGTTPAPVIPETWIYPSLSPATGQPPATETMPAGGIYEK